MLPCLDYFKQPGYHCSFGPMIDSPTIREQTLMDKFSLLSESKKELIEELLDELLEKTGTKTKDLFPE